MSDDFLQKLDEVHGVNLNEEGRRGMITQNLFRSKADDDKARGVSPTTPSNGSINKPAAKEDDDFLQKLDEIGNAPPEQSNLEVAGKAAFGAGIETAPILPTAMKAGQTAYNLMPIPNPYAKGIAGALGFLGGGFAAWYAGSAINEELADKGYTISKSSQVPKAQLPYFYAGQSFGGSAGVFGGVGILAKTGYTLKGKGKVSNFVNEAMRLSTTKTGAFVEASSAVSAAFAAGIAEDVAPDETALRVAAEIAAGLFNPAALLYSASNKAVDVVGKTVAQRFNKGAREKEMSDLILNIVRQYGEDPAVLARILKSYDSTLAPNATVAQMTGSPALGAIERELRRTSAEFGHLYKKVTKESFDALLSMEQTLFRIGDPESLAAAAEIKQLTVRAMLNGKLKIAENEAFEAASKITQDTPKAREQLSIKARDALGKSLKDARKAERELWEQIDKSSNVGISSLTNRFKDIKADLLPEVRDEKLPDYVSKFIKRIADNSTVTLDGAFIEANAGEMMALRSELLDGARELTKAGKYGQSRIMSELADAVLEDLDIAFKGFPGDEYDTARMFSRELNNTFGNGFVGKALATGKYGDSIAPELLLSNAVATGKQAAKLKLQELEEATRFMVNRGVDDTESFNAMMDAQQRFIRLTVADTIDPVTGVIGVKKASAFMRDNEALMARFPEIKQDLAQAGKNQEVAKNMAAYVKNTTRQIQNLSVFGKLVKSDPIAMATRALVSTNQEKQLTSLINFAKGHGDDAKQGLKAAIFDAAARKATGADGSIDLNELNMLLAVPAANGKSSPIELLKKAGMFTKDEIKTLDEGLNIFNKVMVSVNTKKALDLPIGKADALISLLEAVVGSSVARVLGKKVGAESSIILPAAGARFMKAQFSKLSALKLRNVLIDAMTDPELMRRLLVETHNPIEEVEKMRRLHSYLISSGMYNTQQALNPDEPRNGADLQ